MMGMDLPRDESAARSSTLPSGAIAVFLELNTVGWMLLEAATRLVTVPHTLAVAWLVALPLITVPLVGKGAALLGWAAEDR